MEMDEGERGGRSGFLLANFKAVPPITQPSISLDTTLQLSSTVYLWRIRTEQSAVFLTQDALTRTNNK